MAAEYPLLRAPSAPIFKRITPPTPTIMTLSLRFILPVPRLFAVLCSALLMAMAAAPRASAASAGGDYIHLSVPNLTQAAAFFEDVMRCAPLSPADPAGPSTLLECAGDTVVELDQSSARHAKSGVPVQFAVSDAASAERWLKARHLQVVRHLHPTPGNDLSIQFLTPWGQPIELVGDAPALPPERGKLAAD